VTSPHSASRAVRGFAVFAPGRLEFRHWQVADVFKAGLRWDRYGVPAALQQQETALYQLFIREITFVISVYSGVIVKILLLI